MYAVIVGKNLLFPSSVLESSYKFKETGKYFSVAQINYQKGTADRIVQRGE